MIPSPYRAPGNQFIDIELNGGSHEVIEAISRPDSSKADRVIAVADANSFLWIPNALCI